MWNFQIFLPTSCSFLPDYSEKDDQKSKKWRELEKGEGSLLNAIPSSWNKQVKREKEGKEEEDPINLRSDTSCLLFRGLLNAGDSEAREKEREREKEWINFFSVSNLGWVRLVWLLRGWCLLCRVEEGRRITQGFVAFSLCNLMKFICFLKKVRWKTQLISSDGIFYFQALIFDGNN